jgi:CDP-diacylglycerol---glycerol-3-phosphate 3-phosphatidyltransferase
MAVGAGTGVTGRGCAHRPVVFIVTVSVIVGSGRLSLICSPAVGETIGNGRRNAADRRMANLITLARFLLLFVLVAMAYWAPPQWQLLNAPLLVLIISLDGLDGYVARRRNETTVFGSIFDIAVDRVVENVLWIVLGNLGLIPIWVAIVFIVRGAIVDSIRYAAISGGKTVYGMMASPWGRALVSSRGMRAFYGALKAVTFAWVLLIQPWPKLNEATWAEWAAPVQALTMALVVASVLVCLLRGVPVVWEFVADRRVFAPHGGQDDRGPPAPVPAQSERLAAQNRARV